MTKLPKLPDTTRRLHELRWAELIAELGFDGSHLKWHESPERRRQAAAPPFSLSRPASPSETYYNAKGKSISHPEWVKYQQKAWVTRETDPAVIDSIGVSETLALGRKEFLQLVNDYRSWWATETEGSSDDFCKTLKEIRQSVLNEISGLWRKTEWHSEWFDRVCLGKLDQELHKLVEAEIRRTQKFEKQHLENPHLPLSAIVPADGKLEAAALQHNIQDNLRSGREALERSERVLDLLKQTDLSQQNLKATEAVGAIPTQIASAGSGDSGEDRVALTWDQVEICFVTSETVEVTLGGKVEHLRYTEMGFGDKRGGKIGSRGPVKAWGWLQKLARDRGVIDMPLRREPKVAKGSRDAHREMMSDTQAIAKQRGPTTKARDALQATIKDLSVRLKKRFPTVTGRPILFELTRYRAVFKVGQSENYSQ